MEYINAYEEDLKEVNSQIEKLQKRQVKLTKAILKKDACDLIGNICDKVYHSKNSSHFVIFHHVIGRANPGFDYHGYYINQNGGYHNFSVCNHQEVFTSKDDFNDKYELVDVNPECELYDLIDALKSVNHEQTNN